MKKLSVLFAIVLAFCLVFTGCADNSNPDADKPSASSKPVATDNVSEATEAPTPTPAPADVKNVNVYVLVENLAYSHVVEVEYNDNITTWDRSLGYIEMDGYDLLDTSLDFVVPNDGTEIEFTAVIRENAPYKVTGWSGDFTADGDTIKFTPAGKTIFLTVKVEPLYENVALNSTVTASVNTVEYADGRWGLAYLTDGDVNMRFSTATLPEVDPETLIIPEPVTIDLDLGAAKGFDTLCLVPRVDTFDAEGGVPNFPFAFEVLISNDGTEYTSVLSVDSEENVDSMMQVFALKQQNAQYLRLKVTKVGNQAADEGVQNPYRVQFAELLLFDAE